MEMTKLKKIMENNYELNYQCPVDYDVNWIYAN